MANWRSSIFYYFFSVIGGTFSVFFLSVFYAKAFGVLSSLRLYFTKVLILSLLGQGWLYLTVAQSLPAPFELRTLLNHPTCTSGSSLMGLIWAFLFHHLIRSRYSKDLWDFIRKDPPLVQSLLCCGAGGLLNIALVTTLWWAVHN